MCLKPFVAPCDWDRVVKKLTRHTWSHSSPLALCKNGVWSFATFWVMVYDHSSCRTEKGHARILFWNLFCFSNSLQCEGQTLTVMLTPLKASACDTHASRLFESRKRSFTLRLPTAFWSCRGSIRMKEGLGPVVSKWHSEESLLYHCFTHVDGRIKVQYFIIASQY